MAKKVEPPAEPAIKAVFAVEYKGSLYKSQFEAESARAADLLSGLLMRQCMTTHYGGSSGSMMQNQIFPFDILKEAERVQEILARYLDAKKISDDRTDVSPDKTPS